MHASASPSAHLPYRPDIDGLRAIAVALVLLVHGFPQRFTSGFVGVDVFFVISGYLITGILLREFAAGRFSIRDFYVRRINRIFPPLLLVLVFVMAVGLGLMYRDEYLRLSASVFASAVFTANVHFFMESGYWDVASKLKPLLHLWSLGVEEQFYLVWPLVLWAAWRRRQAWVTAALLVVVASLVLSLWLTPRQQPAAFYLPLGRFWEMATGGLLAALEWRRTGPVLPAAARNGAAWVGAGLLLATQWMVVPPEAFPGRWAVVVVLAAALLVAAGPQAWFNRRVLAHPAMVYGGKISYPLYLWHWPLLVFARLLGDGHWSNAHRNQALVAAVLLAMATHHALERPLVRAVAQGRVRRGRLAWVLGGLMAATGSVGLMAHMGALPLAPQGYVNAGLDQYEKPPIRSRGVVALLGDSNAGHMSYGLTLLYGERLRTYATPGWPYLDGVRYHTGFVPHPEHTGTPARTETALRAIESDAQVRLVILSNAYNMYIPADTVRSVDNAPPHETAAQAYQAGMRRTLERLVAHGKKVLVIRSIPTYSDLATVMACAPQVRPPLRQEPAGCTPARNAVDAERAPYNAIVDRVIAGLPGVQAFNTLDWLCDTDHCYVNRNGHQIYIDAGHYTTVGSELMGAAVAQRVEAMLGAAP